MTRKPDITGPAGRCAWLSQTEQRNATALVSWICRCPGDHLLWNTWLIALVHLRDVDGIPPAHKQYAQAEYEVMFVSLVSGESATLEPPAGQGPYVEIDPDDPKTWRDLQPVDLAHQFHGVTDADAKRIVELAIRAMVAGTMSPDSDFRERWKRSLDATVSHFVQGVHGRLSEN